MSTTKKITLGDESYEIPARVFDLLENLRSEYEASNEEVRLSRDLIGKAALTMQPLMAILPLVINPETEGMNALELVQQLGKFKADPRMKDNITALQLSQAEYAKFIGRV
jgi:hypothetical protein